MKIEIPKDDTPPRSALDGYTMQAIDTDPAVNVELMQANARARGLEIVAVIRRQFTPGTWGYLVVTYRPEQG